MHGMVPGPRSAWGAEIRATFALAWPIALTNLAQMAMIATDIALLGRVSPEAMAAATIGGNLFYIFYPLTFGLAMATAPMLAQARGRKRSHLREMRRTVRQGGWGCVLACLLAWPALWHADPLLRLLGQEPEIAALGQVYVRALMWEMLPIGLYLVLRGFLAALERPLPALAVAIGAVLLNGLVAWALIFGHFGLPALGVAGAGWASTFSGCVLFAGLLGVIARDPRMRRYRLAGRFWRPDLLRLVAVIRLGLPISIAFLFEIGVFNAAAFVMGWISVASVAAHAVAINLTSLAFMVPMGLSQAATARVGLAIGAGDAASARRAGWAAIGLAAGFMACSALVMIFAPRLLVGIFADTADPREAAVVALAASFLLPAGLFQIADGLQTTAAGALRGLYDTRVPMLYAALGYWGIALPLALVLAFPAGFGGLGVWLGLGGGLLAVAALMVGRWTRRSRLLLPGRPSRASVKLELPRGKAQLGR